jgi:sialate O-acetylesterase
MVFILLFVSLKCYGEIIVNGMFSDNMVIQRDKEIIIDGTCNPKEYITIKFDRKEVKVRATKNGFWKVSFPPKDAGGPYKISISTNNDSILFKNILIGDIWLAAGQSNMEHPMEGWKWLPNSSVYRYEEEMKDINYPEIRILSIRKNVSSKDIINTKENWEMVNYETIKSFSSVGWFFAKQLYQKLKVPIGIINCTWAGTSIKSWESKTVLDAFKDSIRINQLSDLLSQKELLQNLVDNQNRKYLISDSETEKIKTITESPDSAWIHVDPFDRKCFYQEIAWLKHDINISEIDSKKPLYLSLGFINYYSAIYFNGKLITSGMYPEPIVTIVPRSVILPGKNAIVIRMSSTFGIPNFEGAKDLFCLETLDKSFKMDLSSNWRARICRYNIPLIKKEYQNYPGSIYSGMVAQCIRYKIKGIIWYQGENDINIPYLYNKLFKSLVLDWRNKWKEKDLPFLYVQISLIPSYLNNDLQCQIFRSYQKLNICNTYMINSLDVGDPYNIHPRNKKVIGDRLALTALQHVYNYKLN